jgi:hypothetical protein
MVFAPWGRVLTLPGARTADARLTPRGLCASFRKNPNRTNLARLDAEIYCRIGVKSSKLIA